MKKSKLSITLVTSFIAAMALTACKEVTASKEAIVSFKPYGSEKAISLITDDVYNSYRGTTNGVTKFYEKILEVLIRYEFMPTAKGGKGFNKGEMDYSEIETWADNQVKEQKDKAKANAKSNKTSYDDEWDAILESNGVEDAKELKEKFIYQKEKEVITNWYADDTENAENLKNEFLGIDKNNKPVDQSTVDVKAAMPYHVRHILVKVDEAANANEKFYKGTVTESQAKRLSDIVTTLASGKYTFSQVASMYSEDGSASSGGDVGIMTNNASSGSLGMVNEFQLGIYAYDNLYDTNNKNDQYASIIQKGLGIDDTVKDALKNSVGEKVVEVPYEAFVNMGLYASATADKEGNKLAKGSETLYPRNILWNKYFNLHNVFVIKNATKGVRLFGQANAADEFKNLCGDGEYATAAKAPAFNTTTKLLEDENHNVIIGVRSQYGIHFMIIEESMYDYAELATYYSTKLPNEEGYSSNSYVGFIQSQSTEDYKKRADDVKSKITSFDATYDYRLYQSLLGEGELKVSDNAKGLDKDIERYISVTKKNNAYKQEDGLEKVWRTYYELIEVQQDNRSFKFKTINAKGVAQENLTRLVSEQAAEDFMKLYNGSGTADDYKKFSEDGGYYYYA